MHAKISLTRLDLFAKTTLTCLSTSLDKCYRLLEDVFLHLSLLHFDHHLNADEILRQAAPSARKSVQKAACLSLLRSLQRQIH